MTKHVSKLLRILGFIIIASATAKAEDFTCPAQIVTKQSLGEAKDGYEEFIDKVNERHFWTGVSFYDGPPIELAELVPDNESEDTPPYWTFSPGENPRPFYLVCRYSDTSVRLARKLPPTIRKCTTSYEDPKNSRSTESTIRAVTCTE